MFYQIDHLNADEQDLFESTYDALIAAEEAGSISAENLDKADEMLAWGAACDAGYALPWIQKAWEWLT